MVVMKVFHLVDSWVLRRAVLMVVVMVELMVASMAAMLAVY